jgi:transcriptional regulator with XRE-family HTH domain
MYTDINLEMEVYCMKETQRIATTAERLREAMDVAGKKQLDLAKATGLSHSTISRYLSGQMEPKQKAIYHLATALDVSEMWLWGYDVPRTRTPGQKKNDVMVDVVKQLRKDPEFFDLVSMLAELPADQYASIKQLVSALRNK